MRVLLVGATGQLGLELYRCFGNSGEVRALVRSPHAALPDAQVAPGGDDRALATPVDAFGPDVILNAAAWTDVDGAESDPAGAYAANAELPAQLARLAARHGALLVHYSTDYVFDGSADHAYTETDQPAPASVYGASKLEGEGRIGEAGCQALILRTSWVYSSRRRNFLRTIARRASQGGELAVVDDQYGCPTWARDLAQCTLAAVAGIRRGVAQAGLYHVAGRDAGNWWDFAVLITNTLYRLGVLEREPEVRRVTTGAFPSVAPRPANSRLDSARFAAAFGTVPGGWSSARLCVTECIEADLC